MKVWQKNLILIVLVVLLAARLDLVMGTGFIRDGAALAFLANELLSVVENVGLMGVPVPKVIAGAIRVQILGGVGILLNSTLV